MHRYIHLYILYICIYICIYVIYIYLYLYVYILLGVIFFPFFCFCFKQLLLNVEQKFKFLYHLADGERLLSEVVGVVSFSADTPLKFFDITFFQFLKYDKAIEQLSKIVLHH